MAPKRSKPNTGKLQCLELRSMRTLQSGTSSDESSQETTGSWKASNPVHQVLLIHQAGQSPRNALENSQRDHWRPGGEIRMIRKLRDFCASSSQFGSKLHSSRGAIYTGSRSLMSLHYFNNEGMKSFPQGGDIMDKAIRSQDTDGLLKS